MSKTLMSSTKDLSYDNAGFRNRIESDLRSGSTMANLICHWFTDCTQMNY